MSDSHGSTPAAWTTVAIMFVGFLIAGIAVPFSLPWLFVVGLVVVVVGAVVGKVLQMASAGDSDDGHPDKPEVGEHDASYHESGAHGTGPGRHRHDN